MNEISASDIKEDINKRFKRWVNPGGSPGGRVALDAHVDSDVFIHPTAMVLKTLV